METKRLFERFDTSSIAALSDGVFGVALTLLVLDVHLLGPSGDHLAEQLLALWPSLFSFSLTFFVVAIYWIAYHRLIAHIVAYDRTLLARNFVFLALVALTPFPTSLIGEEHVTQAADVRTAWIMYAGTLALVGLTLGWLWHGARVRQLTDPRVSPAASDYLLFRTLASPLIFLLSIGVVFLSATLAHSHPAPDRSGEHCAHPPLRDPQRGSTIGARRGHAPPEDPGAGAIARSRAPSKIAGPKPAAATAPPTVHRSGKLWVASRRTPNSTPEMVEATCPTARLREIATPARPTPNASVVIVVRIGSVSAMPTPPTTALHATASALWITASSAHAATSRPTPAMMTGPRTPRRSDSAPAAGPATASPTLISAAMPPAAALVKRNSVWR